MIKRIPFWQWFLIISGMLYATYNPSGYSLYHAWVDWVSSPSVAPALFLASVLDLVLLALVFHGTWRSIGFVGVGIIAVLIALVLWTVSSLLSVNLLSGTVWPWVAQLLASVVLTIGWQWPKIWRSATGAVNVTDPDTPADEAV